jgi:hypothetical protein
MASFQIATPSNLLTTLLKIKPSQTIHSSPKGDTRCFVHAIYPMEKFVPWHIQSLVPRALNRSPKNTKLVSEKDPRFHLDGKYLVVQTPVISNPVHVLEAKESRTLRA